MATSKLGLIDLTSIAAFALTQIGKSQSQADT
jgi:hypothetical protein